MRIFQTKNRGWFLVLKAFLIFGLVVMTSPALAVQLEVQYPEFGGESPGGGPASWVRYIFFLALALTSIAAVGSLIYAGIVWMTSASSERVREAQKQIWAAVGGIILVAGSVVILRTINPDLVSLRQPTLESIRGSFGYGTTFGRTCEVAADCGPESYRREQGIYCDQSIKKCLYKVTQAGQDCSNDPNICGGNLYCSPETGRCEKVPPRCMKDPDCKDSTVFYCKDARPEYQVYGTCKRR